MIKLMIFDHDMTIVDSCEAIRQVFNYVADQVGRPRVTRELVMKYIAAPLPEFCKGLLGEYRPEWVAQYLEHEFQIEQRYLKPFPDMMPTIEKLRSMGLTLAVASNRDDPTPVMKNSGIAHLFDAIIGGFAPDGRQRPYKPDPAMLLELMEQFHVQPELTAYVGDSDIDMETANRAGVRGIGIPRGNCSEKKLLSVGAWRVIHSLEELLALAMLNEDENA